MVREDGVAHGDVTGDTLVVAAVGKDAEGGGEVFLAVLALFLWRIAGICADLEGLAVAGFAERLHGGGWCAVRGGVGSGRGGDWGDGGLRASVGSVYGTCL